MAGAAALREPHASHSRQVILVGVRKSGLNRLLSRRGCHGL
jgi:hypothetical protein